MSKIGKKPIIVPAGVTVQIQDGLISAKGAKGELKRQIPASLNVVLDQGRLQINPKAKELTKEDSINWGLTRALVNNMITGVSSGFEVGLEFQGVGYKATPKGNKLELSLGFSHPIIFEAPDGISFVVEKNTIKITGIDKEVVGSVAAQIRAMKTPEPYKGHGVRYSDEIIKKKAGKKAVASGG